MEKVIKELGKNFNLNGKELLIVEALLEGSSNAHNLSKTTNIALGRIYDYLNNLIKVRLVDRSEKKPYIYSIDKFDENIADFLKYNFEDMVQKQHRIMHLLEHRTKNFDEIEIIESGDDFSFRTIQLLKEAKFIKNVVRHGSVPFSVYPDKIDDFSKVRRIVIENRTTLAYTTPEMTLMIYQAHEEAYKSGKSIEYIVERQSLNSYLNLMKKKFKKEFYNKTIEMIKERLEKYNVKIYVLDEFVPMQIFVTDKKVFLALIHLMHTQGIILMNKTAEELYSTYFDDLKNRCKQITEYI